MPELLLELFSEEIPARMQRRAAEDLRKLVTDALVEAGLVYEGAKAFATPRRLALTVHGIPARSPDRREERKGPRVGAPLAAIEGFLKAAGLGSIAAAKVQPDKKGEIYVAVIERPGSPANDVIAAIVPKIVRGFPWPKSMRWGKASAKPGSLVWVRPLHSIVCTFGSENEEPEVVAFDIDGVRSGNVTRGHRFMAPAEFSVRRLDDYQPKLEKAKVVLDADRRKDIILHGARDQAFALGLELVEDEALLEEVAGLVEWPVVLTGSFDPAFLDIPPEVIRATIRANQKCFVLRNAGAGGSDVAGQGISPSPLAGEGRGEGSAHDRGIPPSLSLPRKGGGDASKLSNRFILVANIEASDGGKAIVAGNERVIRARLSDARHFWKTDLAPLPDYRDKADKPLDQRLAKLKAQNIVFHEKLGTQGERVERIARLAREIAPLVGADSGQEARSAEGATGIAEKAERAANLAKADLVSEMVGEFPELQGLMGRYYATAQGEDPSVAAAIEDHYKPVGPNDRVPTDPVAIAVALADKLDTLVGFWAIDEKPTGSKDPYALRRAALGVIRIVLENGLRIPLTGHLVGGIAWHNATLAADKAPALIQSARRLEEAGLADSGLARTVIEKMLGEETARSIADATVAEAWTRIQDLLAFFADRLKVQLREQGARHDLVDAVFALGQGASPSPLAGEGRGEGSAQAAGESGGAVQDDLLLIVRRVEALGLFLETDDGKNLLAGTKRAANILRDEEKKSGETYIGAVDPALLKEPEEKALTAAAETALPEATAAVGREEFAAAMTALARLRAPVDAFFEKVRVNDADPAIRANRLRLLNKIREATLAVADFSKIAG